jgi:predicted PurR-regulated permease PerM
MQQPPRQQVEIIVPTRALVGLVAFGVVVALAILSLGTLLSIFVAAVLALGLDPVVAALVRRGWPRGRAALFVFGTLLLGTAALVVVTVRPLWDEVVEFVHEIPAYWDQLTNSAAFQKLISESDQKSVHASLQNVVDGIPDAANTLLGAAGGVFGVVLSLVTLSFLALFLLMERPTITNWLFGFTPLDVEKRWRPVLEDSILAVSSTLIGNVAISFVAATVAGVSAWILGMPFPIVLAVITGLLDLIPQVGATIAAVILTLVALTVSTPTAVVVVIIQIIYQQLENYVVYPIVYRRAVELSPFTTIAVVLVFAAILGVVGAILAVPFAAVIKTVVHEAGRPRRERMEAQRNAAALAATDAA